MTDGYSVDTDVLRDDANKYFSEWKADLLDLREAVPTDLAKDDFSNIPGAEGLYTAYSTAAEQLKTYLKDGSTQMDYFARTLLTTVRDYMIAEQASQSDIDSVKQELEEL